MSEVYHPLAPPLDQSPPRLRPAGGLGVNSAQSEVGSLLPRLRDEELDHGDEILEEELLLEQGTVHCGISLRAVVGDEADEVIDSDEAALIEKAEGTCREEVAGSGFEL